MHKTEPLNFLDCNIWMNDATLLHLQLFTADCTLMHSPYKCPIKSLCTQVHIPQKRSSSELNLLKLPSWNLQIQFTVTTVVSLAHLETKMYHKTCENPLYLNVWTYHPSLLLCWSLPITFQSHTWQCREWSLNLIYIN